MVGYDDWESYVIKDGIPHGIPLLCAGRRSFRFVSTGLPNCIKWPCFMGKTCSKPAPSGFSYFDIQNVRHLQQKCTKNNYPRFTPSNSGCCAPGLPPVHSSACQIGTTRASEFLTCPLVDRLAVVIESTLYLQGMLKQNCGSFLLKDTSFEGVAVIRFWATSMFFKGSTRCTIQFG